MSGDEDDRVPGNGEERDPAAAPKAVEEKGVEEKGVEPVEEKGLEPVPEAPPTRQEWEALKRENHDLRDQLLRRRADFENYRRRVERDRQQAGIDAAAAVLRALIPTLDNLDRALEAPADGSALRTGVELIRRELWSVLESHGVAVQDPVGQPFDPRNHQALSHEPVPGHAEGTVVEVFSKGYAYKDRLLRPALVKVAKASSEEDGKDPEAVH
jgi:molecular chaperone GrpE